MQLQHHVNAIGQGGWPRGLEVTAQNGQLICRWTPNRIYDLVEAYSRSPHLQFLKCKTDQQLATFVTAWGPLRLTPEEWSRGGLASIPISSYRIVQRWLKASANLINAFKTSSEEVHWLQEFLSAEFDLRCDSPVKPWGDVSELESMFKVAFGINEDTANWLQRAASRSISDATAFVLSVTPFAAHAGLACTRKRGKPHIEAGWRLTTLEQALSWMVWYDEFNQHSLIFCQECFEPFRSTSAHPRKYCSAECGHRVAARNWRRKDLRTKRSRDVRNRKVTDGPRKAR